MGKPHCDLALSCHVTRLEQSRYMGRRPSATCRLRWGFTHDRKKRKISPLVRDTCAVEGQGGAVNSTHIRTVARSLIRVPPNHTPSATDAELFTRFIDYRDEGAFERLVARHLPGVRAVCGSVLHDSNDADDAVQATFLVLVRRASAVRDRIAIGA